MSDQNPPVDHIVTDDDGDAEKSTPAIEENLKAKSTWIRLIFMLILGFLGWLASMVAAVVVVFGFFWVLFTGEVNQQLRQVGQAIASYIYEIVRYLTFNTDDKPFPFGGAWPSEPTETPSS